MAKRKAMFKDGIRVNSEEVIWCRVVAPHYALCDGAGCQAIIDEGSLFCVVEELWFCENCAPFDPPAVSNG